MVPGKKDNPSGFTDSDRAALEDWARERRHRQWFLERLKTAAQWIAAVALGVTVAWDALARLISSLVERP